jgi:hypothetical protein
MSYLFVFKLLPLSGCVCLCLLCICCSYYCPCLAVSGFVCSVFVVVWVWCQSVLFQHSDMPVWDCCSFPFILLQILFWHWAYVGMPEFLVLKGMEPHDKVVTWGVGVCFMWAPHSKSKSIFGKKTADRILLFPNPRMMVIKMRKVVGCQLLEVSWDTRTWLRLSGISNAAKGNRYL